MDHLFRRLLTVIALLAVCSVPFRSLAEAAGTVSEDYEPLHTLAEPYGFRLGGCFGYDSLSNPGYMEFVSRHFNSLTCTNETKA